jgi:hypothetical protein
MAVRAKAEDAKSCELRKNVLEAGIRDRLDSESDRVATGLVRAQSYAALVDGPHDSLASRLLRNRPVNALRQFLFSGVPCLQRNSEGFILFEGDFAA